jgi:hypothetical protein
MSRVASKRFDRAVRIEVLRARAALERETLVNRVETFSDEINPLSWLSRLTISGRTSWLKKSIDLLGHYPFITSALSSMLLRKSTSRVTRGAGMALMVLQAVLAQKERDRTSGL